MKENDHLVFELAKRHERLRLATRSERRRITFNLVRTAALCNYVSRILANRSLNR